jgi:hypothetical protein
MQRLSDRNVGEDRRGQGNPKSWRYGRAGRAGHSVCELPAAAAGPVASPYPPSPHGHERSIIAYTQPRRWPSTIRPTPTYHPLPVRCAQSCKYSTAQWYLATVWIRPAARNRRLPPSSRSQARSVGFDRVAHEAPSRDHRFERCWNSSRAGGRPNCNRRHCLSGCLGPPRRPVPRF